MSSNTSKEDNSKTWCSDALHDLLGYSDSSLASYLTSTAKKSKSYHSILQILQDGGVQPTTNTHQQSKDAILTNFAKDLYAKCKPSNRTNTSHSNSLSLASKQNGQTHQSNRSTNGDRRNGGKNRLTHAEMMLKASTYELLEEDDDDDNDEYDRRTVSKTNPTEKRKAQISTKKVSSNKIKERKQNTRRRRRSNSSESSSSSDSNEHKYSKNDEVHKRHKSKSRYDDNDDDNDDDNIDKSHLTASERAEIDREMDLKQRDEFVKRLHSRDSKRTKQRSKQERSSKSKYSDGSDNDDGSSNESDENSISSSKHTKKKTNENEKAYLDEKTGTAFSIDQLRKESRRAYLKKREERELTLLEQSLRDEEDLFGKNYSDLTAAERKRIELSKRILAMARKRDRDGDYVGSDEDGEGNDISRANQDGFYRLPDDYEQHQKTKSEQNSKLLSSRYIEEKLEKSEQELWEEKQKNRVNFGFGNKKKKRNRQNDGYQDSQSRIEHGEQEKKYDYVFEDQIDFVMKDTAKGYDEREPHKQKSDFLAKFQEKKFMEKANQEKKELSAREKMTEGRKKLPVYPYREEFLSAVKSNQVLILVGETGSGKTTQIPQYLHEVGYSELGKIGCTQPRRVAAMSVAARVSTEMGCKLGHQVGYSIRFENCTNQDTVIQYMTDGMLLREFLTEPDLKSYSCLVIDEAHERTLHTDILFGLVKDIVRFRDDLRLIISSATLDAEKFSRYFDDASIFMIPGRMYPVDIYYTKAPEADYVDAAVVTVLQIHVSQPTDGDILVFLTGQEEIETAAEILTQRTRNLGSRIKDLIVCPIYANLPSEQQAKIFEKTPRDSRKVVLATNIAETSLTIDGICYVIDTGFNKEKSYNARSGMESLMVTPISQAAAKQRSGRAGRTQPGKCFRLFTAFSFENELDPTTTPEILRTNMANVVLMLKSLGINDLLNFDFMDAPPADALIRALEQLYALGALNNHGELTKLGRRMAEFPLDPMLSKAVIASEKYECVSEVLSTVSMLSIGASVFYRPKEKAVHADTARMNFARGGGGDHISLLRCYTEWANTEYSSQWCFEHYIQVKSMRKARDIREQLEGLCERVEVDKDLSKNPDEGGMDSIIKAITSGFFYNTAKLGKSGDYQTVKQRRTVYIHPSSVLAKEEESPGWLVYFELAFTSKEFMRQVAPIQPNWLIEIAPHFYQESDVEDPKRKKMPKTRK